MSQGPLMPKATAVWLVENTSLTFDQIAAFCQLHPLEVKGIADGEVAAGIKGQDPIARGELSRDELDRAQADSEYRMKLQESKVKLPDLGKAKKGPRYTPVSRRQDRPNAILWLTRFHPELKDAQIIRLVGTTKTTIQQIKERAHWNSGNLTPMDPVTLSLCSQIDLDFEVGRAAKDRPAVVETADQTLLSAERTTGAEAAGGSRSTETFASGDAPRRTEEPKIDVDSVFAKLKALRRTDEDDSAED